MLIITVGLDAETMERHKSLTQDFVQLFNELKAEGYFEPSPRHIIYRLAELLIFAAMGLHFLNGEYEGFLRIFGILSFAMFGGRCGWLMHEGGHHSLTGNSKVDRLLQAFLYGKLLAIINKIQMLQAST